MRTITSTTAPAAIDCTNAASCRNQEATTTPTDIRPNTTGTKVMPAGDLIDARDPLDPRSTGRCRSETEAARPMKNKPMGQVSSSHVPGE